MKVLAIVKFGICSCRKGNLDNPYELISQPKTIKTNNEPNCSSTENNGVRKIII